MRLTTRQRTTRRRILLLDAAKDTVTLAIVRSLGSAGHVVDMGLPFGSRVFSTYSKYCNRYFFYPDPSYALNDFLTFFKAIAGKYDFIIPKMEKTQLAISRISEYLEKMGTTLPIPDHDVLNVATDKLKMLEVASKNQIAIPKTIMLAREPVIKEVVGELGIPFIMKTSREIDVKAGPGSRYFVIKREISQKDFLVKFRELARHGPVILQQYIDGVGVGVSFIFSRDCKLIAFFGHRRILEEFPEGGPSVIAETYFHPEAAIQGFKLLSALNWRGVAMTEFKLGSSGKLYFLEINPRWWGTLPLAIASSIDFPKLLIDYFGDSQASVNLMSNIRKRVFIRGFPFLGILKNSLDTRDSDFTKKILESTLKIKNGFPFIEEFGKFDLLPQIWEIANRFYSKYSEGKPSRIGRVFFGPEISYDELTEFHIRSIVDLREESEKTNVNGNIEYPVNGNIVYHSFPIKDDSAPELASFLSLIFMIMQLVEKGPVYIHCRLGRGRAPMVVAAYLISRGAPIHEAYSNIYRARPFARLNLIQEGAVYEVYRHFLEISARAS